MIRDAQQQHGLRHGDYQRYRGYCTRRVGRLRNVLRLPQGEKRHYKKRDVQRQYVEGPTADERFLHIPLILAERAWAYAMQLRQEANTEPRKRFHLIGKLRKACGWALQLQELCTSDACDARTKLEAGAYVSWMHGTLHFELALWQQAAENLKKAQVVYENLMNALPEEEQTLYRAKCDELTPSLRYCAYNIGESASIEDVMAMRAQGLGNLDALVLQTKTQSSETLQTAEWRGRKVTVRPDKVRLFLLSIQELDKSVEAARTTEAKIELIENVLIDCKDAIAAVREEMKQDPKLRQPESGAPVTAIQFLLAYLSYIRLIRTLERNIYLVAQAKLSLEGACAAGGGENGGGGRAFDCGKKVRAQDLTRLYEIISQNVTELRLIAGMEEDAEYQREIEVLALSFKAFRCYYIAVTLVGLKRWKEAVALYERSTNYATEALAARPTQFGLDGDLKTLLAQIESSKFSAHAYSVLEDDNGDGEPGGTTRAQRSTKPLYERLSQYREDAQLNTKNPNVFKLTADMQPIPCKPLFFDLALNFVEFPSLEDHIDAPGKKAGGAAGLSGFVKGFLGWGAGGGAK